MPLDNTPKRTNFSYLRNMGGCLILVPINRFNYKIFKGEISMSDAVYKSIELTGSSKTSMEDAVQNAIVRASKTIRHMRWFEVVETRGTVDDGQVGEWQVTVKIGFKLEDDTAL